MALPAEACPPALEFLPCGAEAAGPVTGDRELADHALKGLVAVAADDVLITPGMLLSAGC